MQDDQAERWLPLAEAAAHLGVSTDTARRRLRKGLLVGEQRPTPQGFTWWVRIGAAAQAAGSPTQPAQAGVVELAQLVRDLQRQNLELAGLLGSLQQRLVYAEDRVRALEAPREKRNPDSEISDSAVVRADVPEIAPHGPTDGLGVSTTGTPSAAPQRASWWRRWLGTGV